MTDSAALTDEDLAEVDRLASPANATKASLRQAMLYGIAKAAARIAALAATDPSNLRLAAAECEMLGQDRAAQTIEQAAARIAALTQQVLTLNDLTDRLESVNSALLDRVAEQQQLADDMVARAAKAEAERDALREALREIVAKVGDCEGMGPLGGPPMEYMRAIRDVANAAIAGKGK